ncbi:MAG: hypothetical protein IKL55_03620 [Clostridia bacterium]|nr:hypothetical protein [Clostridia bacterium]
MARMKTFFIYLSALVGFLFLSLLLEDALIENMYVKMDGEVTSSPTIIIDNYTGKATNVNGYMQFRLSNKSKTKCDDFVKIDIYSEQGLLAATKYVEITDLEPGYTKNYQLKLKGNNFASYKIAVIDASEVPDKSNILNLFGWEFDLTNVFGMDLSNITIFGVKLAEFFTWENIKTTGGNVWNWTTAILNTVPWWGYLIGGSIILWYMPKGFLFGLFPF